MEILDRARELSSRAVESGRRRIDDARTDRRRDDLLRELGEARYAQSKGVTTSEGEIERIIAEIDDLDRTDEPETVAPEAAPDEDPDEQASGTE